MTTETPTEKPAHLEDVLNFKLSSDVRDAAKKLGQREARYLVDLYYMIQEMRKRAANQALALSGTSEPNRAFAYVYENFETTERRIQTLLSDFSLASPTGVWSRSIVGIGPVLSAGLLAYITLDRAPTVGHIYSFAGLDPSVQWYGTVRAKAIVDEMIHAGSSLGMDAIDKDGKPSLILPPLNPEFVALVAQKHRRNLATMLKWMTPRDAEAPVFTRESLSAALARRPWSASLKVLSWKIGESFCKVSGNPKAFYGMKYVEAKAREVAKNESGAYREAAANVLSSKKLGKSTEAFKHYTAGRLPPAHIQARAKRWTVKLFLSHWHEIAMKNAGLTAPTPDPVAFLGHTHRINPPMTDGK